MDEILPKSLNHNSKIKKQPTGCSTIVLNSKKNQILAHTEDALSETLNHYYFVVAHIINDIAQGKYNIKEERFMSLCYAGHLPGYTMNYNHHGLIFSINTLSAEKLRSGKTPRHFITRALLATENFNQALMVLRDNGVGAGDGCSINLTFINESNLFYNIEMAPAVDNVAESVLDVLEIPVGKENYHANKYERIRIDEANKIMYDSSVARMNTFAQYELPKCRADCLLMLGDQTGKYHTVFRENGDPNEPVKTICVGVFDINAKTLTLYSDNPRNHEAHVTLPLILKN